MFQILLGIVEPALIYKDNTSAMKIANGTESTCSRFLLINEFAVHQAIQEKDVEIKSVLSEDQVADIMTKALEKGKFVEICRKILCPISF